MHSHITVDGRSFLAAAGDLLLDAALGNGIDLPFNCRSGFCGTCRVRLVSGRVNGGEGSEPGTVHACQARVVGDAVVARDHAADVRSIEGVLTSLRPLSREVMEVGVTTERALPHHAGQFAYVRFHGYPSRPFSITYPVWSNQQPGEIWFHVRRMKRGRVTAALGKRISLGHRVELTGPFGSAHFRANLESRMILIATNTGFAPIWAVAIAALREKPDRLMMIISGGRNLDAIYMEPALAQLARFPNVQVVPVCSTPQNLRPAVRPGRPTDYLPRLFPSDVVYACGAPEMVESIRAIASRVGATCHADPFLPQQKSAGEAGILARASGWLSTIAHRPSNEAVSRPGDIPRGPSMRAIATPEAKVARHQQP